MWDTAEEFICTNKKMFFSEELYLLWSSLELFMAVTHFLVLAGLQNTKLGFLRRQKYYFLLDAITHLINLVLYVRAETSILKFVGLILWSIMLIGHIYYFLNLHLHPPLTQQQRLKHQGPIPNDSHKISRIFHWSCVEFQANRFHFGQCGKEISETVCDIIAHSTGFYLAFQHLQSLPYRLLTFLLMFGLLYRQMLNLPYFLHDPKMMPSILRKFHHLLSSHSSTIDSNWMKLSVQLKFSFCIVIIQFRHIHIFIEILNKSRLHQRSESNTDNTERKTFFQKKTKRVM